MIHQFMNSLGNYTYNAFVYSNTFWELHFHKNYELIYVICGHLDLQINDSDYVLSQGELILIPPYAAHTLRIDESSKVWISVFSEDYILSFAKKHRNMRFSQFRCDSAIEAFLSVHLFYQGTPELYMAKACLYMVCSECQKHTALSQTQTNIDFIGNVIDYVSAHFTEDITLTNTATALGYESHYFSSLFHNCFTINFKEFVNMLRFEQACSQLLNTDKEITDIANDCGFQSIRSFNRVFKNLSGQSPRDYRQK